MRTNGAIHFGRALAILRISRGMSRAQLAEAAEVLPISITHYERGRNRPRENTLDRIMEALSLPREALDRAEEFARHPAVYDGTLPADARGEQRKGALRLARECGRPSRTMCSRSWKSRPAVGGRRAIVSSQRIARQVGSTVRRLRLQRVETQRQVAGSAGIPRVAWAALRYQLGAACGSSSR